MNGTIRYTIRPYDTIWMLAQVFNTTVDSIMELNPGIEPRNLSIGHVLTIRPGYQYYPSTTPPEQTGMESDMMNRSRTNQNRMEQNKMNQNRMDQNKMNQARTGQSGMNQPRTDQSGTNQPRTDQSGMNQPRMDQSSMNQPRTDQSGMNQPRTDQSGMNQTRMDQSGMNQTRTDQSGMNQTRTDQSGMNQTRPSQSGMDQNKMDQNRMDHNMMDHNRMEHNRMDHEMMDHNMMDDMEGDVMDLRDYFRLLWDQHVEWTRMAVMGMVHKLPDSDLITKRLLRNPEDFANALAPFYGEANAQKFNQLLTDHLTIAAEIVKAAMANDNNAVTDADKRWHENAEEIAKLLASLNPYWKEEDWSAMLNEHLDLLSENVDQMISGDYEDSINGYDEIELQALEMGDMMSEGIAMQFPD